MLADRFATVPSIPQFGGGDPEVTQAEEQPKEDAWRLW
jgi:hypothetical protein